MIISHKLQVIFIAPIKVSCSSFTAALKHYCGEGDVVTDILEGDKHKFVRHYNGNDFVNGHASASEIKCKIPRDIWDNYLKVSIVRCVYDTIISLYYFESRVLNKPLPNSFNEYVLLSGNIQIEGNFSMLCEKRQSLVDYIIRYENADEDIMTLEKKIGCVGLLDTYKSMSRKTGIRPPGQDIFKVYTKYPIARELIDAHFTKAMKQNKLVREYYPLYKERLSRKIPRSGYFPRITASLIHSLYEYRKNKLFSLLVSNLRRFPIRSFSSIQRDKTLV